LLREDPDPRIGLLVQVGKLNLALLLDDGLHGARFDTGQAYGALLVDPCNTIHHLDGIIGTGGQTLFATVTLFLYDYYGHEKLLKKTISNLRSQISKSPQTGFFF
jgi:hypothetical protein